MVDRKKLEAKVEKETYKFMDMIKESASDHVMLWANRNSVDIDGAMLQAILEQFKTALDTEYMNKVDIYMRRLDTSFAEFTDEENPLPRTASEKEPKKTTRKNAQKSA